MERVKFYSIHDMMCGANLRISEKVIKEYVEGKEPVDINDVIELYNVKKYFDNQLYLSEWKDDEIKNYKSLINSYFSWVAKFFNSLTEDSFVPFYNKVDLNYRDDFLELIDKFNVYEKISEVKFKEFLNASNVWLHNILRHKNITEHFGEIIREYMLHDSTSAAEILLDKYEIKHINDKANLYVPKVLSNKDKEFIINDYIDTEKPNLNYLQLITNIQSNKDKLEISPKILLKARRKVEEQQKQFLKENSGILMETTVAFSNLQTEEVLIELDGHALAARYSTKWIEDNIDYQTLLNNFIYLFEFVDSQMRCTLVNKYSNMGVFERFVFTSSQNAYKNGIAFEQMNALSLLQIMGYYNQLFSLGIRLEEIVEWFFHEYLHTEFHANNFKVTMPSNNSTLLEKCTNILPALESILKQFSLFVEEGEIDFELLEIRSQHLIYKNIPSLVQRKYVYGIGEEYKTVSFLLFSDQSGLGYSEKTRKSYTNFFEMLCYERCKQNDYPDYDAQKIEWLIDKKYLSIDGEGYIIFPDKLLIIILKDLNINEVISYWKYSETGRTVIELLERKGLIEFESSLFSRNEQDYINYFLNKAQYNNGLDLRNKYSHTQPFRDNEEKIHNQNYMIFLRIFILAVIKINDEFCMFNEMKKQIRKQELKVTTK